MCVNNLSEILVLLKSHLKQRENSTSFQLEFFPKKIHEKKKSLLWRSNLLEDIITYNIQSGLSKVSYLAPLVAVFGAPNVTSCMCKPTRASGTGRILQVEHKKYGTIWAKFDTLDCPDCIYVVPYTWFYHALESFHPVFSFTQLPGEPRRAGLLSRWQKQHRWSLVWFPSTLK